MRPALPRLARTAALRHLLAAACLSWTALATAPLLAQSASGPRVGEDAPAGSRWSGLSAAERRALQPLARQWSSLSEAQRRKWIALSRDFDRLSPTERQTLQQRMGEWVALSPVERNRARLNFARSERFATEDKQALWEAYQALSEDERRRLAAQAPPRPTTGGAPAVRPSMAPRLTTMPIARDNRRTMPRIATSPHLVDPATLLPQVDVHATDTDRPAAQ